MPDIHWSEEMTVGVPSLDEDHKMLIALLNELGHAIRQGHAIEILDSTIDKLVAYTETHMKHEEELFRKTNYPYASQHAAEHSDFLKRTQELRNESQHEKTDLLSSRVLSFMTSWFMQHIMITDKKFADHMKEHSAR